MSKFKIIPGLCPVLQITTDNMPDWAGGMAKGPITFIRPKYVERADVGLINHEIKHTQQWYLFFYIGVMISVVFYLLGVELFSIPVAIGIAFHSTVYTLVPKYRLYCEVQAYKEQMKAYKLNAVPDWIVKAIFEKYNLQDLVHGVDTVRKQFD